MRKLELQYLHCVDCESQDIYRNGKSKMGVQRFMCKECSCQFVAQFDAIFPQSKRRDLFEQEFLSNLKPTGFDKVGSGQKKYWIGAKLQTLQMLESQTMRVQANKYIKNNPIRGDKCYQILMEFLLHEAYNRVTC